MKMQWLLPGALILLADRITKALLDGKQAVLVPHVIGLRGVHNTGMALGLMEGKTWLVLVLSVVLIGLCLILLRRTRLRGLAPCAVSLMAGGALGNLIDRIALGYVIDLFELLFMDFYIFNVADAGVVAGAALCAVSLLIRPDDWSRK